MSPLLDIIAPTHTEVHDALHAAAHSSHPSHESHPLMLKYIISQDPAGFEHITLFDRDIEHKSMVPAGFKPVAAGFVMLYGARLMIPEMDSLSLHLGPRPQDREVIAQRLSL